MRRFAILLGTVTPNAFSSKFPWAGDALTPVRVFAVSCLRAGGAAESFLSDTVTNDGRDHDGLSDVVEDQIGSDKTVADTDGDILLDGKEYVLGTSPVKTDTDGDGYSDYEEVQAGSDPLDPASFPLKGDIDGDCKVDLTDVIKVLQILVGMTLEGTINPAADVDDDRKIGEAEIIYILKQVAEQ